MEPVKKGVPGGGVGDAAAPAKTSSVTAASNAAGYAPTKPSASVTNPAAAAGAPSMPAAGAAGASSSLVLPFVERTQTLSTLTRSASLRAFPDARADNFQVELKNYHKVGGLGLALLFLSDADKGHSDELAAATLKTAGPNVMAPPKPTPTWVKFLFSFVSGFQPLIWFATLFVFLSWQPFGTPPSNVYNLVLAIALVVVIVLSALLTFYQEYTATTTLASFKGLLPTECVVVRGGVARALPAAELVPGDLVQLAAGDRVPADVRIVKSAGARVSNAMLTGESAPVPLRQTAYAGDADVTLLEAKNVAFAGASVVDGSALGMVFATGNATQVAQIAKHVVAGAKETTLQREINYFVYIIAAFAITTGVIVIIHWAAYLKPNHPSFMNVSSMIANAISVIVAFVPEGLPLALSVGLTIIARRLCLQYFVLVKQLGTVETLGSMSLVCSDKTGTLTQNKMTAGEFLFLTARAPGESAAASLAGVSLALADGAGAGEPAAAAPSHGPRASQDTEEKRTSIVAAPPADAAPTPALFHATGLFFALSAVDGAPGALAQLLRTVMVSTLCNGASIQAPDADASPPESPVAPPGGAAVAPGDAGDAGDAHVAVAVAKPPVIVGGNGVDKALLAWAAGVAAPTPLASPSSQQLAVPSPAALLAGFERAASIPFSSTTKISVEVVRRRAAAVPAPAKGSVAAADDAAAVERGLLSKLYPVGAAFVLVKGAPEYVLAACSHANVVGAPGLVMGDAPPAAADKAAALAAAAARAPVPLTPALRRQLADSIDRVSAEGKRVVALAQRALPRADFPPSYAFDTASDAPNFPMDGLTLVGLVALSDPPREDVPAAIAKLRKAGIKIAMVTGDAPGTAVAIARQVGLVTERARRIDSPPAELMAAPAAAPGTAPAAAPAKAAPAPAPAPGRAGLQLVSVVAAPGKAAAAAAAPAPRSLAAVVTGAEVSRLTAEGWSWVFSHDELVFARTTPEQKLQIVREAQSRGHRVGVTGDGVNDAPALKAADVGVAMASGSDVARDAAAIVLLNDSFASLVQGVAEGRLIFANLRKVIAYQIAAGCYSELLPVLATFFLGMPQPLSSFLMIIISCVTDVCAGVALMHEPQESELMSVPPRDIKTVRLVTPPLIFYSYFFYGTLESVASFVLFFSYMAKRGPTGLMPDSLPSDDDGAPAFAMGYTPKQLTNAWNWGSPTGNLGADEVLALNTASSIFFVSLVAGQFFHLLSVRRSQSPYFSEVKGATPLEWLANAAATVQPRANILLAWLAAVVTAVLFTEVPWLQAVCQTGSVPALYWVYAFLFSFGVFCAGEARKWLIHLSPEGGLVRRLVVW